MKMKQKLAAALCGVSLLCSVMVPVSAADLVISTGALTRGQLVTQLYEAAGSPTSEDSVHYEDVAADADCAEAVQWATSEELINGYEDGTFRPEQTVTREQLAVILYRCAQAKGQGFTGMYAFRLPYDDAAQIHDYAYEAVCWMTMNQVMGAADENQFAPAATVSADEAQQVFEQFSAALKS